jgi:septal ring factor EnvC (AmiA/AmiB activator)
MEAKAVRPNLRQRSRAVLAGLALSLACGLMCSTAQADWLVSDWQSMAKAVKEYAEQAKRWAATAQQYRNTVEHYRQQLISLKQLNASLFAMQNTFEKVPADYNVADACPGPDAGGISLSNVLQSLAPDLSGSVTEQQLKICRSIVMLQNRKYNDTVDYIQQLSKASHELEAIESERATVGTEQGKLAANDNEAERFQNRVTDAQQKWESNMVQSDAQIAMLQNMQGALARRAMNGSHDVLGEIVDAVALKAAFQ